MEFKPVLRFGVMSDIHYNEDRPIARERFASALDTMYSYAEKQEYKIVDALYIVGDFADTSKREQMQMLKEDCDKYLKDETLLTLTLANHELHYGESEQKSLEFFAEVFGMPTDRHKIINGFHFISVSTTNDGGKWHDSFDAAKRDYLKTELEKAASQGQNKPIFVFQHPGVYNTSPGAAFGNLGIYDILKEYQSVVDFAGHSHLAANDPREIHQRDFTVVGTGSLLAISTGRSWLYKELSGVGYNPLDFAQMSVVEVDEQGIIRIKYIDAVSKSFFEEERIIDVTKGKEGFTYTENRTASAPVFDLSATVTLQTEDEKLKVKFPKAEGDVWYYGIKLFDRNKSLIKEENIPSHFASASPETEYSVTLCADEKLVCFAEVTAVGFFGNFSTPISKHE